MIQYASRVGQKVVVRTRHNLTQFLYCRGTVLSENMETVRVELTHWVMLPRTVPFSEGTCMIPYRKPRKVVFVHPTFIHHSL